MSSFTVTIKMKQESKDEVIKEISTKYQESLIKLLPDRNNVSRIIIGLEDNSIKNILEYEIKNLNQGIISVQATEHNRVIFKIPKNYSLLLFGGLLFALAYFAYNAFLTEGDVFTNSQSIVIEVTIALLISGWLFKLQNRWQSQASTMLIDLEVLSSEIREALYDK